MKNQKIINICNQKLIYLNYSENTIKTYINYIEDFVSSFDKQYAHLNSNDFSEYIKNYKFSSVSQQNQIISSIKFLYKKVLKKKYSKVDFTRPRKQKKIPKIIDAEILVKKIRAIENIKHKAILTLGLSCGLRVSEVINLKWKHLDRNRNVLYVINGKGNKDRVCVLNNNVISLLEDYWKKHKSKEYVFNGQGNLKYSQSSVQNLMKKYIGKQTSYHFLRHSYSTYALDNGTELMPLSKSLGHKSTKTTEIYYHNSIKSLRTIKQAI